ncbi:nuclear transport factor 2 family protein [Thermus neutrinimicus]|uniref:nuclear transport factor 2 family protein n=1 Tax=Thermus neutrinimicus TaxID=2908149 RepID=UPI001FA9A782|nr:nuclear transport factor 2 family protein [Thermus neutrinimicus]
MENEAQLWEFLERHLASIYQGDWATYEATTHPDLSLYEWFVAPHRLDGLAFHRFMIEHNWATSGRPHRLDLLERRLQRYGDVAIFTYTLLLTVAEEGGLRHRAVNESRVAVRFPQGWKVVHVHKSPAQ